MQFHYTFLHNLKPLSKYINSCVMPEECCFVELFLTLEMEVETLREPVELNAAGWEESKEKNNKN